MKMNKLRRKKRGGIHAFTSVAKSISLTVKAVKVEIGINLAAII